MTVFGLVYVVVSLYLIGALVVGAGVFTLTLVRVSVPMSWPNFLRWSGWIGVATLLFLLVGDVL